MVAKPYNCTHIGFYHKSFATLCINVFLQSKLLMWFCWYLFWNMWWPWHLESNCGRTWNPEMWCVEQPWEETCEILRNTHLDTLIQLFREPLWETFCVISLRDPEKRREILWETLRNLVWNPLRDPEKAWETLRDPVRDHERPWETMRDLERPWETLRDLSDLEGTWIEFYFLCFHAAQCGHNLVPFDSHFTTEIPHAIMPQQPHFVLSYIPEACRATFAVALKVLRISYTRHIYDSCH